MTILQDINILVCDDDKEIAGAIEIYLRNEGYKVFKTYNGEEALEIVRRENLHLIIMDVMMPKMDGIQATMKIREEKKKSKSRTEQKLSFMKQKRI